jgi:DNA sulfur modification protein DndC
MASCATGGECGQDFWYTRGPDGSNRHYYAPVIHWRTCKVWDFLAFVAPQLGWPTENLFRLYGAQDLRFGCWTCTLVKEDRTMMNLIKREEFKDLKELFDFRNLVDQLGRDKTRRVKRLDGKAGPINMATRRELLEGLLALQDHTGRPLITSEEVRAITKEWERVSWRNENTGRMQRARTTQ